MNVSLWGKASVLAGITCALCFGLPSAVRAEDEDVKALKERLDRLEKRNDKLEKQNENLLKMIEASGLTPAGFDGSAARAEVGKLVDEYLKQQGAAPAPGGAPTKPPGPAQPQAYEVGKDLNFKPMWRNGLYFETGDKAFKVHVGGRLQADAYWFTQDAQLKAPANPGVGPLNDGAFFRRIRLEIDGTAWEILEWDLDMAFETGSFDTVTVLTPTGTASVLASGGFNGGSSLFFQDAWVGLTQLPYIGNVRFGHLKVPMGLESLTSSKSLTFLERATIFETFFQEYDPAILLFNNYLGESGTWHLCFHRIDPQEDNIDFGDGDYAVTGRVTFLPIWEHNGRCLAHVGGAFQYRNADDGITPNTVRFRSRPEFRANQDIVGNSTRWVNTGNIPADNIKTLALEAGANWGPISVSGEYVNAWVDRLPAGDASYNGWYVQASYFLTGEHRGYDRRIGRWSRVIPNENFFAVLTGEDGCGGCCCGKGAWEVAARYSVVDLTDFVAADGIGGRLEDITFGINWYINPNFTIQWNYVRAHRQELVNGALSGDASAYGMRVRLDF